MKNNKPKTWKAIVAYSISKYLKGRKVYVDCFYQDRNLGVLSYSPTDKIATIESVSFDKGRFMLNVSYNETKYRLWMLFNTPNVLFAE
jgi:hypothetical protein